MKDFFTIFVASLIILFTTGNVSAQKKPEINFQIEKQNVLEPKEKEYKASIKITASGGEESSYPVKFTVKDNSKGSAESEDYTFTSEEFQIDKDKGTTTIWITINNDNKIEAKETIVLEIEENDEIIRGKKSVHTISIDEVSISDIVRLTTGVDFDFQTDGNPLSFYGELNGFLPDLFNDKYGVAFKIFSNRYSSIDSLISSQQLNFITGNRIIVESDTLLPIQRISLSPQSSTITRNFGLSFSPLIKIISNEKTSLFLAPQLEGLISTTNTFYTYDTTFTRNDTLSLTDFNNLEPNRGLVRNRRRNLFISNMSLTLPFRYMNDNYEIRIIPGVGYSKHTFLTETQIASIGRSYYMLEMNVLERNFGITIGGEIKSGLNDGLPLVNIFIAKSFNFVNFARF